MNLNKNAVEIAKSMIEKKEELRIDSHELTNGTKIIDCGVKSEGSIEAGRLFALASMGALAKIDVRDGDFSLKEVRVETENPQVSCLSSQKAGWRIEKEDYSAMGSGPARILARKPRETIERVGYTETSETALITLESNKIPSATVGDMIAKACQVSPGSLYIMIARTASHCGTVQISARMVETALLKMDYLGLELNKVKEARGTAPIAPIIGDDNRMMGLTNDMIIYGSKVLLRVSEDIDIEKVPSTSSKVYGKPFAEIFKDAGYNFYKVGTEIFAPAEISIENTKTGEIKKVGKTNFEIIKNAIGT